MAAELDLGHPTRSLTMERDCARRKAADAAAVDADQVQVLGVLRLSRPWKLVASHAIAQVCLDEDPGLCKPDEIPIDRCPVQSPIAKPLDELRKADRAPARRKRTKYQEPLLGHAQILRREQRAMANRLSRRSGRLCHDRDRLARRPRPIPYLRGRRPARV